LEKGGNRDESDAVLFSAVGCDFGHRDWLNWQAGSFQFERGIYFREKRGQNPGSSGDQPGNI
jgi:hypothetical protein